MIYFPYFKSTIIFFFRPLPFAIMDLVDFYKNISEFWNIINNYCVWQSSVKNFPKRKYGFHDSFGCRWLKKVSLDKMQYKSTKYSTGVPSMYRNLMYNLALSRVFSVRIFTRFCLGTFFIFWHGSQVDMRYSSLSRVLGIRSSLKLFSTDHTAWLLMGERIVCEV